MSISEIEENGLPKVWEKVTLEQVVDIHDYLRMPINAGERESRQGSYPYYGATGQIGWIDDYRQDGEYVLLGEDGAPFFDAAKNKAYLVTGKCWVNNHAHVLKGCEGICENRYLMYSLNFVDYRGFANGTTRLKLTQSAMKQLPINLAPLNEQKRIVAKIEELFSKLDAGIAALERVQANLKRYRAAVLKAAVEGKLTEEWRKQNPNTESASKLLQRILKERRQKWESEQLEKYQMSGKTPSQDWQSRYKEPSAPDTANLPSLPNGWRWATLDQLIDTIEAGKSFKCQTHPAKPEEWGIIKVSAMSWGEFKEEENKAVFPNSIINPNYEIKPYDLLLSRANTPELVGASVLVKNCRTKLLLSDKSMRLIVNKTIDRRWLAFALSSQPIRKQMSDMATGTSDSMRNISQEKVGSVIIALPPSTEQIEIINVLELLLSNTSENIKYVSNNLKKSSHLRQSILKQAFSGKLVPQDPNDEPASVLLQRIKNIRKQENTQTRVKSTMYTKSKLQSKEPKVKRSIYETLLETNNSLSPEELFTSAGFGNDTEEVEEFYEELRTEINDQRIIEERHDNERITLEAKKV